MPSVPQLTLGGEARNLRLGAGVEGQSKMPFKKGQSGNPGGRPKIAEINALARQHCPEAIERLVHIMRNGTPDTAREAKLIISRLDRRQLGID